MGIFGESKKELREKLKAAEQEAAQEKERFDHWYQSYQSDRTAGGSSHHRNTARSDKRRSG